MTNKTGGCILCSDELSIFRKEIYDTRFGIEGVYDVGRCNNCGLIQLKSSPAYSELKKLYEEYYNFGGGKKGLYIRISTAFFTSLLYRIWIAIDGDICFYSRSGTGRLLDLGCNEGRGLLIYKKNGFKAEGLELNEVAAEEARSKGFRVFTIPLEEFDPEYQYDVVVLSHVFEHSLEPDKMLKHVARFLKPSGQVWISCPNIKSWLRIIFGRFWINWHVPFHITFFSAVTLKNLLNKNGFEVTKTRFVTPALWIAQSIIAFLFGKRGIQCGAQHSAILLGSLMLLTRFLFFPLLWLGNMAGRGDCLAIEARKR
jgi:SAM-dependent methyltransferase